MFDVDCILSLYNTKLTGFFLPSHPQQVSAPFLSDALVFPLSEASFRTLERIDLLRKS